MSSWSDCPNLVLLGNVALPRLPIFSFLVRHPTTRQFLHYNFVCAVLNDVFGIQARGGCACAGPYAQVNNKMIATLYSTLGFLFCFSRMDRYVWLKTSL